jgi:WD40 repeat protein
MVSSTQQHQSDNQKTILSAFARTLQRESHVLKDRPDLLWQQMFNRLQWEDEPLPSLLEVEAKGRDIHWIRRDTQFIESRNLLRTLDGDCGPIDFCTFSPDGEKIISSDSYGNFIVWDSMDGDVIREIEIFLNHHPTALSRDGKSIFTIESQYIDNTDEDGFDLMKAYVIIWDLQSGNELQRIESHPKNINSIRLNNDGDMLATASDDKTIKVWDLATGNVIATLEGLLGRIDDVVITPDNQFVIGFDSEIFEANLLVWNMQNGELLHVIDGVTRSNFSMISISPDGQYLITTGWDETKIWDYHNGVIIHNLELTGVNDLAVTPDSHYLVAGLEDTTIRIFELESGEEVLRLEGHTTHVSSLSISPDGKRIVSGAFDGTLKVWELAIAEKQQRIENHAGKVNAVAISSDGAYGISGSADNSIKVWDLQTKKLKHTLKGHTGDVASLVVMPDSRRIVSASHDKTLKVWDLENGSELRTLNGHLEPVLTVEIIPGGTHVISTSEDKRIMIWNLETAELEYILEGHASRPHAIKVTRDGRYAVSLGWEIMIWDIVDGNLIHKIEQISSDSIAITPDGTKVVTWRDVYDLQSGERIYKFKVRGDYDEAEYLIKDINITADGKYAVFMNSGSLEELMVCKLDDKVKKKKKRKVLHNLVGHMDAVGAVASFPDGCYAVSGSDDNSLRVWDVVSGEEINQIIGIGRISRCAVSPDGRQIVAGDESGQVHILELENFTPGPAIVTVQETQQGNLVVQCKLCANMFGADTAELGTQIM